MKSPSPLIRLLVVVLGLGVALSVAAAPAPKKVLVVTGTMGFRHRSIRTAEKILAQPAKESGKFTVDLVRRREGRPNPPRGPRPGAKGADDPAHVAPMKKFQQDK